ncbi:hypothetical protein Tco_1507676 [Tanacetum coccineum]
MHFGALLQVPAFQLVPSHEFFCGFPVPLHDGVDFNRVFDAFFQLEVVFRNSSLIISFLGSQSNRSKELKDLFLHIPMAGIGHPQRSTFASLVLTSNVLLRCLHFLTMLSFFARMLFCDDVSWKQFLFPWSENFGSSFLCIRGCYDMTCALNLLNILVPWDYLERWHWFRALEIAMSTPIGQPFLKSPFPLTLPFNWNVVRPLQIFSHGFVKNRPGQVLRSLLIPSGCSSRRTLVLAKCEFARSSLMVEYFRERWLYSPIRTVNNGEQEIIATCDGNEFTITEASIRRHLQLADVDDDEEDSSKQGRMIEEIDQDAGVTLVTPTHSQEDQPEDQLGVFSAAKLVLLQRQEKTGYEVAVRFQEQFDEEERQRIAKVHEEASSFNIEE